MSLLNDALRKKKSQAHPSPQVAAALFQSGRGRRFGTRHLAAGICAVLVLFGAAGAWGWRQWHDDKNPNLLIDQQPMVAAPTTPATEPEEAPQAEVAAQVLTESAPEATPTAAPQVAPAAQSEAPQPLLIQIPEATPEAVSLQAMPALERSAPVTVTRHVQRPAMTSAAAPPSPPLPARRITSAPLYQKAQLFQRQGRTAEALGMYREVLKLDPNHFDTRLNMSSIYLETSQFTQAYALAADLHRQAPAHPQVMLNLAIAQVGCGRGTEALPLLDQAAALPQAPLYTVYFHKGVALRQLGQTAAAITWYRKAEALNPGDRRLLFNLALAYDQDQAYAPAVDYYLKYMQAAKEALDAAGRGQIQGRVRALQAELAAADNGEQKP
jgi:tetratricopeptide (TPR) repeat protein